MTMENQRTLVAVFEDHNQAEKAMSALEQAGFKDDQIGLVRRQAEQPDQKDTNAHNSADATNKPTREPADQAIAQDSETTGRTVKGVAAGGVVGGILGAAAALLIPGLGPVLAGGIVTGLLLGASGGMAAGGIMGALTNLGLPEEEARQYESEFNEGRTLVTVKAGERQQEAAGILRANGGRQAPGLDRAGFDTPPQGQANQNM
ncbi:MAG: hypothetical protein JWP00_3049 [Chloroflexi bacterium]|nr:hypothetical protein [Chloroflexota bacterium]